MENHTEEAEEHFAILSHGPGIVPVVSAISYAVLSLLKLSIGITFRSAALVADGLDSLIDMVSTFAVLLGVRFGKRIVAASFIALLLALAGGGVAFNGLSRLVQPVAVGTAAGLFVAVVLAGIVSYSVSTYQRIVSRHTGSISLIAQSRDNRGHVFQSVAVLLGLIAAHLGFYFVDAIIALGIGVLMLRSAVELIFEISNVVKRARFSGENAEGGQERYRWDFFKAWTLLTVNEVSSRRDVVLRYDQTFVPDELRSHRRRGRPSGFDYRKNVGGILEELFEEGLITSVGGDLYLTESGKSHLNASLRRWRFGVLF